MIGLYEKLRHMGILKRFLYALTLNTGFVALLAVLNISYIYFTNGYYKTVILNKNFLWNGGPVPIDMNTWLETRDLLSVDWFYREPIMYYLKKGDKEWSSETIDSNVWSDNNYEFVDHIKYRHAFLLYNAEHYLIIYLSLIGFSFFCIVYLEVSKTIRLYNYIKGNIWINDETKEIYYFKSGNKLTVNSPGINHSARWKFIKNYQYLEISGKLYQIHQLNNLNLSLIDISENRSIILSPY